MLQRMRINLFVYENLKNTWTRETHMEWRICPYNGKLLNPVHFAYILSTRAHRRRRRRRHHHKRLKGTRVVSSSSISDSHQYPC